MIKHFYGQNMNNSQIQYFNALYPNGDKKRIYLGKLIHKGGAAGKIYMNASEENSVAKIFHSKNKAAQYKNKLIAMLLNKPDLPPALMDGEEYVQIAWPTALLEDDKKNIIGYLMPLVNMMEAVPLDHIMQKAVRNKLNISEKYSHRVFAAYNVAAMVAALHNCGHHIIDLKPSNISVYKENMMVAIVDCDGFSIQGEKNRYPAEFVSDEYIYPEGMDLGCDEMNEEQDKFALAVILFKLLNNGIHPFSGTPYKTEDIPLTIQDRIENYHYPYGKIKSKYQKPHPYSTHEYFDDRTIELFDRAFTKGKKRPTALEWKEHIWELLNSLKTCKNNGNHAYFVKNKCGLCAIEKKLKSNLKSIKKIKNQPKTIRGIKINSVVGKANASQINNKNIENENNKQKFIEKNKKKKIIACFLCSLYFIFWGLFPYFIKPISQKISQLGIGAELILSICFIYIINLTIKKIKLLNKNNKKYYLFSKFLIIYAAIFIITAFINEIDISFNLFNMVE
jgi:hypothetical protein